MQRRRLAAELQRLRGASGRTLEEVAERLECSPAKISRIENNLVAVRIQDARELLDFYRVSGERREELLTMVREARRKGWWSAYSAVMDESTENLLSLEEDAVRVSIYDERAVSPLLQTPDYARAQLTAADELDSAAIERRVELLAERQRIATGPDGPQLAIVLDEAPLRRYAGGTAIMAGQLDRLIHASDQNKLELRVMPFSRGPSNAQGFPAQIFEFAADPRVVYTEQFGGGGRMIEAAEEVGLYLSAFEQLWARALTPSATRDFLKALRVEL